MTVSLAQEAHRPEPDEPLAHRDGGLLRLPAGRDGRCSPSSTTTCCHRRGGSGWPTTATWAQDVNFWPGVRNTLWMMVIQVPITLVFAFWVAHLRQQGPPRCRHPPDDLLPADAGATGRRDAGLPLHLQLQHRPGGPHPRLAAPAAAAVVRRPALVQADPDRPGHVGHRVGDDHLPGRPARRAGRSCTRRPTSTASGRGSACGSSPSRRSARSSCSRGDHRGHRRIAVLHPGVRRGHGGRRRRRRRGHRARPRLPAGLHAVLSRSGSTRRASSTSPWATPPRWRSLLFVAALVITGLLLLISRRWVYIPGVR